MRYLLCLVLPPVAVLLCGKPLLAVLNLLLCVCLWVPGVIHAFMVVADHKAGKRADKMGKTIGKAMGQAMGQELAKPRQ